MYWVLPPTFLIAVYSSFDLVQRQSFVLLTLTWTKLNNWGFHILHFIPFTSLFTTIPSLKIKRQQQQNNSVEIGAYLKPSWVLVFRSNYGLGSHYFYGFEKNEFKRFGGERMNKLQILSQKFLAVKQALHSIISLSDWLTHRQTVSTLPE